MSKTNRRSRESTRKQRKEEKLQEERRQKLLEDKKAYGREPTHRPGGFHAPKKQKKHNTNDYLREMEEESA